jgi:hypothetical protein
VWRQAGWKDPPIPRALHDAAGVAGELVGEVLGIADAEDLGRGIVPRHHAGKATEASKDLSERGGKLMISRRSEVSL